MAQGRADGTFYASRAGRRKDRNEQSRYGQQIISRRLRQNKLPRRSAYCRTKWCVSRSVSIHFTGPRPFVYQPSKIADKLCVLNDADFLEVTPSEKSLYRNLFGIEGCLSWRLLRPSSDVSMPVRTETGVDSFSQSGSSQKMASNLGSEQHTSNHSPFLSCLHLHRLLSPEASYRVYRRIWTDKDSIIPGK